MKVFFWVSRGLLLLATLQAVRGEYRYKIRGPPTKPLPPRPPIPHFASKPFPHAQFFNTKSKWPFPPAGNSGYRVNPPLRGSHFQYPYSIPQLPQQYLWNGPVKSNVHGAPLSLHGSPPQFQFKGPSLLLGATPLPSWKGEGNLNHGFRAPVLKEQFLPSPPSEYQPPKVSLPQPPVITHIGNAIDDDKGPIHTIPAPNLGPSNNLNLNLNHQHETPFHTPLFPQTHVKVEQSHGYEVHEASNDQAGHTPDGLPTYFAPDPDPSLPAPKIPATTDPHSVPSNGKNQQQLLQPPAVQILDNSGSVANGLSSQELFQLLHSPQQPQLQQPLVDSYGVPLVQQPQLQQHFHQQAALFPPTVFLKQELPSEQVQDNLVFKTDFSPEYQTFNYEEQYQGASHQQENYRGNYQEPEESENSPSVTVVRKSPESTVTSFQEEFENQKDYQPKVNSVPEEDVYYDNTATKVEGDNTQADYEGTDNNADQNEASIYYSQGDGGSSGIATSYFTTLPNREAAETLATLAAAGNINSNLVSHIINGEKQGVEPTRGDAPVDDDYADEEAGTEDLPPETSRPKETDSSEHGQRLPVSSPPHTQDDIQEDTEYVDYGVDLDQQVSKHGHGTTEKTESEYKQQHKIETELANTNLEFGARIRPKRNK